MPTGTDLFTTNEKLTVFDRRDVLTMSLGVVIVCAVILILSIFLI